MTPPTVQPVGPSGPAIFDALCTFLGVEPALVRAVDAILAGLPSPGRNTRVELSTAMVVQRYMHDPASWDAQGVGRHTGSRNAVHTSGTVQPDDGTPHVLIALRSITRDYSAAPKPLERLRYVEATATAPCLSGPAGLATGLLAYAANVDAAAKACAGGGLRNPTSIAHRDAAVRDARYVRDAVQALAKLLPTTPASDLGAALHAVLPPPPPRHR